MGLDCTCFEEGARSELLTRLAGFPPPVPSRRLRTAGERRSDAPRLAPVVVHKVISLWDEPVFPLVRKKTVLPQGAFWA